MQDTPIKSENYRGSYVVGFMFNETNTEVLLIEKTHPDDQRGKLNGVGGSVNNLEHPKTAMEREFREEVGIDHADWDYFASLMFPATAVDFYRTIGPLQDARKLTDEEPRIVSLRDLEKVPLVPSVSWLVRLALEESLAEPVIVKMTPCG